MLFVLIYFGLVLFNLFLVCGSLFVVFGFVWLNLVLFYTW